MKAKKCNCKQRHSHGATSNRKHQCRLCNWASSRFDKNELWCDANSTVVRPDWKCLSFTIKKCQ